MRALALDVDSPGPRSHRPLGLEVTRSRVPAAGQARDRSGAARLLDAALGQLAALDDRWGIARCLELGSGAR